MNSMKMFLWIVGVPFIALQTYWMLAADIGILQMYGFWNAFPEYFNLHKGNGLLLAGLTDFMFIAVISFIWMVSETPKERRKSLRFLVWIISFIVFPGLGFLVFFLYLNPDHKFVSNS